MTPGENPIGYSIDSTLGYTYLDNTTLTGAYAQALGAAVVVLERTRLSLRGSDYILTL
jgi:hypothetical protein